MISAFRRSNTAAYIGSPGIMAQKMAIAAAFSATFFLACLAALELDGVALEEI
jgi:hypothetical protein